MTTTAQYIQRLCMGCMRDRGEESVCPHCSYDETASEGHPAYLKLRSLLCEKYVVGKVLGQGGFGITYLGFDTVLRKKVAIKECYPTSLVSRDNQQTTVVPLQKHQEIFREQSLQLFLAEARNIAIFSNNPHVVNVYDFFEENGTAYMVMDFIEGEELGSMLKRQSDKCISVKDAIEILLPLLHVLQEIHAHKIFHRDISPQNIMITTDKTPVLIDFGAARQVTSERSESLDVVLKAGYSPVEAYSTRGKIGPWTDVYACGATFYRMITGKTPPTSIERVERDDLQKPSNALPGREKDIAYDRLDQVVLQALSVRREDRFQDVAAFEKALRRVVEPASRFPWQWVAIGVIFAGLLSGGIFWAFTFKNPLPSPQPTHTPAMISAPTVFPLPQTTPTYYPAPPVRPQVTVTPQINPSPTLPLRSQITAIPLNPSPTLAPEEQLLQDLQQQLVKHREEYQQLVTEENQGYERREQIKSAVKNIMDDLIKLEDVLHKLLERSPDNEEFSEQLQQVQGEYEHYTNELLRRFD